MKRLEFLVSVSVLCVCMFIAVLISLLVGCAQLGGGQTLPGIIPGVLVNDASVLQLQVTQGCNAMAAQQYRRAMLICSDPKAFVAQLPGNPFVTPAQEAAVIEAQCATDGFVAPMPPTLQVGNCKTPDQPSS